MVDVPIVVVTPAAVVMGDAATAAASGSSWPTEYDCERYVFGVGCKGMAKGICELGPWSRGVGEVCVGVPSPKYEAVAEFGGCVEVGDGSTSASLDGGSSLLLPQIWALQGNELDAVCARARPTAGVEWEPHVPTPGSAEGVLGCEAVGDMEPLAKDSFLERTAAACEVSFSHEARRVGLGGGTAGSEGSWRCGSPSSSELASASESGVARRFSLSRRMDWLLGATAAGKPAWPGLLCGVGQMPELIVLVTTDQTLSKPRPSVLIQIGLVGCEVGIWWRRRVLAED